MPNGARRFVPVAAEEGHEIPKAEENHDADIARIVPVTGNIYLGLRWLAKGWTGPSVLVTASADVSQGRIGGVRCEDGEQDDDRDLEDGGEHGEPDGLAAQRGALIAAFVKLDAGQNNEAPLGR